MSTCRDCIHYELCKSYSPYPEELIQEAEKNFKKYGDAKEKCEHFKDKSKIVELPCKVGDEVWVIEEEDVICYMFLAKSKGCIIATSWINDYDVDETLEYHITETQDNFDTDLAVFPEERCFATKQEAEKALTGGK